MRYGSFEDTTKILPSGRGDRIDTCRPSSTRPSLIEMRRLRDAPPVTQIAVGLYGADAVLVLRVLTSHLGRTGKEVGFGVAAVLALVVDPLLLRYFRRRLDGGNDAEWDCSP